MSIPDKELDFHYSPSRWSHRYSPSEVIEKHTETLTAGSKEAHWVLDCESSVVYGPGEKQQLDIFNAKCDTKSGAKSSAKSGSPVLVYVHGGYWSALGLEHSSFMAPPLCKAGATVISVGYDLAPEVSMDTIVNEVKEAMRYIFSYAKEKQSRGIYLCGHSAGAQLCAMMLACEFSEDDAFDCELIKGAVLVSGVYDLRPLTKTYVNDPLRLTEEDAWNFSPAQFVSEIAKMSQQRDVLIAVAEYDPPEFRRQSAEMEKALSDRKVKMRYMDIHDTDHFSVIEKLQKEDYNLTKEIIRLMKLV